MDDIREQKENERVKQNLNPFANVSIEGRGQIVTPPFAEIGDGYPQLRKPCIIFHML